jgi:hypothetical protein
VNLAGLPPTLPIWHDDPDEPSARAFFPTVGRGTLYEAARRGELPTIKLGRRLLCPTARLLELVGAPQEMREAGFPASEPLADEIVDGKRTA